MSVTLHTNLGDLKVELFCEDAPRTCETVMRHIHTWCSTTSEQFLVSCTL